MRGARRRARIRPRFTSVRSGRDQPVVSDGRGRVPNDNHGLHIVLDHGHLTQRRYVDRLVGSATLHRPGSSEHGAVSAWVDRSPCRPCAQRLRAVSAGRAPRTCGDVKGSEVSLGRFFQDLLVQGEIGNCSLQPCVLLLKLLQPFCPVEVESAVLASPSVISVVGDTDPTYCLPYALAACNGNLDLPELVQDLLSGL